MPRLIAAGDAEPMTLDALIDALAASDCDPRDQDGFAALGPLLARLGRDRGFLADRAVAALKERCTGQTQANAYGAQVFLLGTVDTRFLLRANFWPAATDAVLRASGSDPFFYGVPHDHNFPFLTYGYLGPGYWSDYYEYDVGAVSGVPGTPAGLRSLGRARLEPERLMLYRARRDVHVQHAPDAFSVSLNILGRAPGQAWDEQFRFDIGDDTVAGGLTATASEALVALAVHLGGGDGIDLAHDFAARHPCARMRVTALGALASCAADADARADIYARGADDPDVYVAGHARRRLAAAEAAQNRSGMEQVPAHWG